MTFSQIILISILRLSRFIRKGDLLQLAKMLPPEERAKVLKVVNTRFAFNELVRKRLTLIDFIIEQKLSLSFSDFVVVCPQITVN